MRDYVHLEDLCSAHILTLEKDALGVFNLGISNSISVKEIVETCREVTRHPISVKLCPRRPSASPALYASGGKAREIMGWEPTHSDIMTIVRDAWSFHKNRPNGLG